MNEFYLVEIYEVYFKPQKTIKLNYVFYVLNQMLEFALLNAYFFQDKIFKQFVV